MNKKVGKKSPAHRKDGKSITETDSRSNCKKSPAKSPGKNEKPENDEETNRVTSFPQGEKSKSPSRGRR